MNDQERADLRRRADKANGSAVAFFVRPSEVQDLLSALEEAEQELSRQQQAQSDSLLEAVDEMARESARADAAETQVAMLVPMLDDHNSDCAVFEDGDYGCDCGWSKKAENHLALLQLACGLIAFKKAHAARLAAALQG